jgi:hypothetical protein
LLCGIWRKSIFSAVKKIIDFLQTSSCVTENDMERRTGGNNVIYQV